MTDNSNGQQRASNRQQRVVTIVLIIGLFFGLMTLGSGMSSWRLPDNQQGYVPQQPIEYSHRLHAGELGIDCRFCHIAAESSRHAGIPSSDVCMKCHKFVTSSFNVLQAEIKKADKARSDKAKKTESKKAKSDQVESDQVEKTESKKVEKDNGKLKQPVSAELRKLYDSLGLDEHLKPKPGVEPKSIPWVRVHDLPDYVYFDHRAHISVGVACQHCHGPVESMQRMRQFETLSMGWCVHCHRDATKNGIKGKTVHASTDCAVCHH